MPHCVNCMSYFSFSSPLLLLRRPVRAISEVEIKGGTAHATGSWDSTLTPDKAFLSGVDVNNAWHNDQDGNQRNFPELIWYEFPTGQTFIPARISFRPRQSAEHLIDQGTHAVSGQNHYCELLLPSGYSLINCLSRCKLLLKLTQIYVNRYMLA